VPPTAKQFLAMLSAVTARWVLPMMMMMQTAMSVDEVVSLVCGDVDVAERKFRLRSI
jgi:hypothetical protein